MKCENVINNIARLKNFFNTLGYILIRTELVVDDNTVNEPYYLVFCEKPLSDEMANNIISLCLKSKVASALLSTSMYMRDYTCFICNDNGLAVYFTSADIVNKNVDDEKIREKNEELCEKWKAFYNDYNINNQPKDTDCNVL